MEFAALSRLSMHGDLSLTMECTLSRTDHFSVAMLITRSLKELSNNLIKQPTLRACMSNIKKLVFDVN